MSCQIRESIESSAHRGGVAEWSNAPVLKTGVPQGTVGSNPTPSAIRPLPLAEVALWHSVDGPGNLWLVSASLCEGILQQQKPKAFNFEQTDPREVNSTASGPQGVERPRDEGALFLFLAQRGMKTPPNEADLGNKWATENFRSGSDRQ